jgi:uncharacterized membrane protein YqgA involved in biofilm formation
MFMKFNKRRSSTIFLILGIVFLAIGIATNNTSFSWAAVVFILLSLVLGGRWMRRRRK